MTKRTPRRTPQKPAGQRVLRLDGVVEKTGLSRASIYRMQDAGKFPSSIPLSPNRVGWLESAVESWIAERIAERDAAVAAE